MPWVNPEADPPHCSSRGGDGYRKDRGLFSRRPTDSPKAREKSGGGFGHDCAAGTAFISRFARCDAQTVVLSMRQPLPRGEVAIFAC